MATLISRATGNFTAAGSWSLADATSELDSEANSTASTTSPVASSTFTPGIITINAIAIKLASRVASPTGTFTVDLYNVTLAGQVANTATTVNVSDLSSSGNGWYVFPTNGDVVLAGATDYAVRISTSVNGEVTLYRNATANNWTRQVRTTTIQAPAANDKLLIAGEHTGAGTGNSFTVTMNNTATTSFGPTVSGGPPQGISIGKRGTLAWGTAGSTNYYLKYKGIFIVYGDGTHQMYTSGARCPSTSTATFEADSVANVDSGYVTAPGSSATHYGNAKWPTTALTGATNATPIEITSTAHGLVAGERITLASVGGNTAANGTWEVISVAANTFTIGAINGAVGGGVGTSTGNGAYTSGGTWQRLPYTRLNTDEAAAATVIGVISSAGWAVSDEGVFPPTTRTAAESEKKTVLTVDSATQFTLTAGLTNAHSGTSPTQAEVGNLTRNVKIRGVSASLCGYCVFQTTSAVVCDHVEFTQLGSATALKRGIDVTTTTGSCSITNCSLHDSTVASSIGLNITGSASSNITFSRNVTFNVANLHFQVAATSGTWTADGNLFVRNTDASTNLINLSDVGGTFTNNTMAGAIAHGVVYAEIAVLGTNSSNSSHSNGSAGFSINSMLLGGTIEKQSAWRNTNLGINISSAMMLVISTPFIFGNGGSGGIKFVTAVSELLITDGTLAGDSTFGQVDGISWGSFSVAIGVVCENCTFGVVSGILRAHTEDIGGSANPYTAAMTLRNCLLASSTEMVSQSAMSLGSYVRSQKHDQTAGLHKCWLRTGTITIDTVVFDVSPSVRLTPNNASAKLASDGGAVDGKGAFFVPVASGGTATVSVKVRESVAGDGTDYAGGRAQLLLRKNVAAGIAADVVLATATSASEGAFEVIQGTSPSVSDDAVLSFVVTCDGVAGWLNADSWTAA